MLLAARIGIRSRQLRVRGLREYRPPGRREILTPTPPETVCRKRWPPHQDFSARDDKIRTTADLDPNTTEPGGIHAKIRESDEERGEVGAMSVR
jgi:hypothetical protein